MTFSKSLGILALLGSLAAAVPLETRDEASTPFVGLGTIPVVVGTTVVGCLTDTMQLTKGACATFNGTQHQNCDPIYGCGGTYITLSTDKGTCGAPFQSGSQYEEGGNGVLSCGSAAASSDKTTFFATGGFNNQIGMTLLEDSNGSPSFNTIGGVKLGSTPLSLQDDLGVGAAVGASYALSWSPLS